MKPVVLGEFGSVVEADGFAHRPWKLAELTGDGSSGEDSFSIDRLLNDVETGLPFVQDEQLLAIAGEQHEVGFPMAQHLAAFDLGGPLVITPLFDEACGFRLVACDAPAGVCGAAAGDANNPSVPYDDR